MLHCWMFYWNAMVTSFLINVFAMSYRCWYVLLHVHSLFNDMSFPSGSHTSTVASQNFLEYFIMHKRYCSSFSLVRGALISTCIFWIWLYSISVEYFYKNCILVHLKLHLFLRSLRFSCWHIFITSVRVLSLSLVTAS